ncbi:MAG: hypothetical protein WBD81_17790 [Collimonas pratensis]|uniref:hypothetical protein n=1 Tax=Collimonas pratensis TaxID=279113 RepID=UPI003C75E2A9
MQKHVHAEISVVGKTVMPTPTAMCHQFLASSLAKNPIKAGLSTAELAAALGMKEQSIRKRYSQTSSYFSVTPCKLPGGRLLWPLNSVEQLLAIGYTPRKKSVDTKREAQSLAEVPLAQAFGEQGRSGERSIIDAHFG